MHNLNFWDLSYILYILGFLFVPRLTLILIFNNYVTGSFEWRNLFVGLTIWWLYPALALGFWSKLGFTLFVGAFPRLLLGIIGYQYLGATNHIVMIVFCVIGVLIDVIVKNFKHIYK